MKTTVNQNDFLNAFRSMGRYEQFGHDALVSLFTYLEEMEQDTGMEMELDVIALCCDYAVDTVEDIAYAYLIDIDGMMDREAKEVVLEYLHCHSVIIDEDVDGSILYRQF